uniref:Uncharacterized protein n=1 Tax=Anguilla anguilla TaxID=7936 RepID=A0A0E9TDR8_ANGAN
MHIELIPSQLSRQNIPLCQILPVSSNFSRHTH